MTQRFEPGSPLVGAPRLGDLTNDFETRKRRVFAPMGPVVPVDAPPFGLIMAKGSGSNVWDVEGNRYVDLAAGFGSLLLGHSPPCVVRAIESQAATLLQAMGDLFTSDLRIRLAEMLAGLVPFNDAQVILGQSGADAISAALKTAVLHTGRSEFVAFHGAYHGLSWGPLALCGLRESYRAPFSEVLGTTHFFAYPDKNPADSLSLLEQRLSSRQVAALVIEPILGRGGVRRCDTDVLQQMHAMCMRYGTLLILDEVWTGLGRCGSWFASFVPGVQSIPGDILCLGKGLGGGLPISACVAPKTILKCWSRRDEVVDTSTFAGAPLACATALATLEELEHAELPRRSFRLGETAVQQLYAALSGTDVSVRGCGLMLAVDLGSRPGAAVQVLSRLLERGILVSTGGGQREVVVLTPALNIEQSMLDAALLQVAESVTQVVRS